MNALLAESKLQCHPFMADAPGWFIQKLGGLQNEIEFEEGSILFSEREYAHKFYLILEGEISIETFTERNRPALTIQKAGRGDVLGWSWLYPPYVSHFTARAVTSGKALLFEAPKLMVMAEKDPVFGYELMKRVTMHVIRRLQKTLDLLVACRDQNRPKSEPEL